MSSVGRLNWANWKCWLTNMLLTATVTLGLEEFIPPSHIWATTPIPVQVRLLLNKKKTRVLGRSFVPWRQTSQPHGSPPKGAVRTPEHPAQINHPTPCLLLLHLTSDVMRLMCQLCPPSLPTEFLFRNRPLFSAFCCFVTVVESCSFPFGVQLPSNAPMLSDCAIWRALTSSVLFVAVDVVSFSFLAALSFCVCLCANASLFVSVFQAPWWESSSR